MESLLNQIQRVAALIFPIVWRLAILSLPWQTRWFQEGLGIAGYPWEEGRISIYVSSILIVLTLVCSFLIRTEERTSWKNRTKKGLPWLLLVTMSLLTTRSIGASVEWWIEVALLVSFFVILAKHLTFNQVLPWIIGSLVPHAILGLIQTVQQTVIGSSWFGIASQNPASLGVAVIELGPIRWLRAYGGFPHPNIFGGWLAVAVLLIVLRFQQSEIILRWQKVLYYLSLPLFSFALGFSYSRSGFLGLLGGLGMLVCESLWRNRKKQLIQLSLVKPLLLIVLSFACAFFLHPELVLTRTETTGRLEQKSISERAVGFENGLRVLKDSPFFGSGPGANALVIASLDRREGRPTTIPISPHFVPLLGFAEFGLVGTAGLLSLSWLALRDRVILWNKRSGLSKKYAVSLCVLMLPLLCLDHYLWSYWSGKALLAIVVYALIREDDLELKEKG